MPNDFDTSAYPLGSTHPYVLYNNAGNEDLFVNDLVNETWVDRPPFNRVRKTIYGMEQEFLRALEKMGYETTYLTYVDGSPLQVDRPTQLITRGGSVYAVKLPASFPVTLTGTWATDQSLLVDVGDQSLRTALAAATGSTLVKHYSKTLAQRLDFELTPYDGFGAVGNGIADDTAAIVAWAASTRSTRKHWGDGVFKITQTAVFNPGDLVTGNGDNSVVDLTGSTPGIACVSVSGQLTALPALAATIALKDNAVLFESAHGLTTGDVFLVWNPTDSSWSTWRTDYRAGEWMRVGLVTSATALTIFGLTYDAYSAAPGTVQLYKLVGKSTTFENFVIKQPATSNAGLRVSLIDTPIIRNVKTGGGIYAGIDIDRCVDVEIDSRAIQASAPSGNNYGLILSNTQGGSVRGTYYGTRHSLAIGGAPGVGSVCTRGVIIEANMKNLGPTPSQDLHGNSEDLTFIGGTFMNGGQIAGKNHKFIGCNFIGKANSGIALFMGEIKGGLFTFDGCHFEAWVNPNPSSNGILSFANFTANTTEACDFVFSGTTISCPDGTTFPTYFALNGTSVQVDVEFKGGLTFIRAPDITTVIRLRQLIAAGPGSYGKISMPEVTGIPANCAYVTEVGSPTVASYCLPSQVRSAAPAATTGISIATLAITYPHAYPRAPKVSVANGDATLGGKRVTSGRTGVTATGFTAQVATCDGAVFASAATADLTWTAVLNEV